jgi:predicted dehydrogenase
MLRIGILGAARVAPMAIVDPARLRDDVVVEAIAAARPGKAEAFAAEHGIARATDRYDALVADPAIDIVYIALPPAHHAEYAIKALDAGKHVLCEKPFALNAGEARVMNAAAARSGRRIVEAFHDRYHPVFLHLLELKESGRLGTIHAIEATFNHTMPRTAGEFRFDGRLGGGVMMDYGCYPVHWCRSLIGEEPVVRSARATMGSAGVDEEMLATLVFPSGVVAHIECRMTEGWTMHARLSVQAENGTVDVLNNILPHRGHSIETNLNGRKRQYTLAGNTTFDHQLDAFVEALATGLPLPTEGSDPVNNMAAIDAVYAAAGMRGCHQHAQR